MFFMEGIFFTVGLAGVALLALTAFRYPHLRHVPPWINLISVGATLSFAGLTGLFFMQLGAPGLVIGVVPLSTGLILGLVVAFLIDRMFPGKNELDYWQRPDI